MALMIPVLLVYTAIFAANFYLLCQWVAYPKQRHRFEICQPYLRIGWSLYFLCLLPFAVIGIVHNIEILIGIGGVAATIGAILTVYAAIRLLKANDAERFASGIALDEEAWPPPPNIPKQ